MTTTTCQIEWVRQCKIKYRVDPPSGYHYENAHFPLSEKLGEKQTTPLWYPDHIIQGCLQTLNLKYPCIDVRKKSFEREIVSREYPEYLETYDLAYTFVQTFAAKKLHEKQYELVCHALKRGRETQREREVGIYAIPKEDRVKNGRKGGRKGGGHTKKPVVCQETSVSYSSACDASQETGINRGHIGECCRGTRRSAGGKTWRFA